MGLWGLALGGALAFGCGLPWPWRAAAALAGLALVAPAALALARPRARVRVGIEPDGRWWIARGEGERQYVHLRRPPLVAGRHLWLSLQAGRRRTVLYIDGRRAEPQALRRLKTILGLNAWHFQRGADGP